MCQKIQSYKLPVQKKSTVFLISLPAASSVRWKGREVLAQKHNFSIKMNIKIPIKIPRNVRIYQLARRKEYIPFFCHLHVEILGIPRACDSPSSARKQTAPIPLIYGTCTSGLPNVAWNIFIFKCKKIPTRSGQLWGPSLRFFDDQGNVLK